MENMCDMFEIEMSPSFKSLLIYKNSWMININVELAAGQLGSTETLESVYKLLSELKMCM